MPHVPERVLCPEELVLHRSENGMDTYRGHDVSIDGVATWDNDDQPWFIQPAWRKL